jgi:hypothetical protein
MSLLMRAGSVKKVTPGITGLSRARVRIDLAVRYLDVDSSYPGLAQRAKGEAARLLKGIVSWV